MHKIEFYIFKNTSLRMVHVTKKTKNLRSVCHKLFLGTFQAILVTLDNKRLGLVLESHALIAQMAFDGKWRSCASKNIHLVAVEPLVATFC